MRPAAVTALAVLCLATPARAQLDMVSPVFQSQTLKNVLESNDRAFGRGPTGAPPRQSSRAAPSARPSPTTAYRASPAVSARVRQQFSAWMATRTGAEGGRRVAATLDRVDPVRSWSRVVASEGLAPGDAADALAAYWVLNWVMANQGDSTRAQTLAVRNQARAKLLVNPIYARQTDAQRQAFAETLMLNFLLEHAAYEDVVRRGDQATQRRLGEAAAARFQAQTGVDPRRLALTNQGFGGR